MVQASEIRDEATLKVWLEARPEETRQQEAVTLAHRAAMRVLPLFVSSSGEDWARKRDLTALTILRCALISGAYMGHPAPEIKKAAPSAAYSAPAAYSASASADSVVTPVFASAAESAAAAAVESAVSVFHVLYSAYSADSAAYSADSAAYSAADSAAYSAAYSAAWVALRQDAAAIEAGDLPFSAPLWADQAPDWFQAEWQEAQGWLAATPGHDFWIRWYEAALTGRPLTGDWESHAQLLTDIALIADEDWKKGAEHIDEIIRLIGQKHALKRDIAALKRRLDDEIFNAQTLGAHRDNMPEDMPVSVVPMLRQKLEEAQQVLTEIEAALEPPIPDPAQLRTLAQRLREIWASLSGLMKFGVTVLGLGLATVGTGALNEVGAHYTQKALEKADPFLSQKVDDLAKMVEALQLPKAAPSSGATPSPQPVGPR